MAPRIILGGRQLGVPERSPPYTPYVPPKEDEKLVANCGAVLKKNPKQINALSDQEAFLFSREIMEVFLPILQKNGRALVMLSSVNKCAYFFAQKQWAATEDSHWAKQLADVLSNVKFLPPNQCSYSYFEQFKIIVHRLHAARKPYTIELKRCWEAYDIFKKEHDALLKSGRTMTKNAALKARKEKIEEGEPLTHDPAVAKLAGELYKKFNDLSLNMYTVCGNDPKNPAEPSIAWRMFEVLRNRIPAQFNNQMAFENVIRQSKAMKVIEAMKIDKN